MKLFTKRRMLAAAAGSVLLHTLAFVSWPHPRAPAAATPAPPPLTVAFETATSPPPLPTRVAMVGPRPAGRGRELVGKNPVRHGSPEHALRTHAATGQAKGPGVTGAVAAGLPDATAAAAGDPTAQAALAPEPSALALPVPLAGTTLPQVGTAPAAPTVDAAEAFDRLVRAQQSRLARGNGGGLVGAGSGGDGVGLGLATELSGRHVAESHVVTPPVVADARPIECELPESLLLAAVVRVLVTQAGAPAVPRLLQPSGQAAFDRCAVAYVLAMRFVPGRDAGGRPLDVWMNVRVAPVTGNAVGAAK